MFIFKLQIDDLGIVLFLLVRTKLKEIPSRQRIVPRPNAQITICGVGESQQAVTLGKVNRAHKILDKMVRCFVLADILCQFSIYHLAQDRRI